jgi:hypothetical protein
VTSLGSDQEAMDTGVAMRTRMNRVLILMLLLSVAAAAEARGPVRASEGNTRGWQLMTPEERIEHSRRGLRSERLSAPASVAARDCSALVRQGSNRGL